MITLLLVDSNSATALGNTTRRGPDIAVVGIVGGRGVDTDGNPAKQTVAEVGPKVHILKDWVRGGVAGLRAEDAIIRVVGDGNGVGVVLGGSAVE